MNVRRTASALALAAALIGGSASAASAHSVPTPHTLTGASTYAPAPTPVQVCKQALIVAHNHTLRASAEDRAVRICGRVIRTERQADALYRWASTRAWALRIIG